MASILSRILRENPSNQIQVIPWYEKNSLWGAVCIFFGLLIAVVAAMMHDPRILLWIAAPFGIFVVYCVLKGLHLRKWLIIPCALLICIFLLQLNIWLSPTKVASSVQPKQSNQSPPQEIKPALKEPKNESQQQERDRIRQRRVELIKQSRTGIESISDSEWYQHGLDDTPFRNTTWYSSLRPYMKKEAIEKLETPRVLLAPKNDGEIQKKIILLDEVARIEKEWGLTGYKEKTQQQTDKEQVSPISITSYDIMPFVVDKPIEMHIHLKNNGSLSISIATQSNDYKAKINQEDAFDKERGDFERELWRKFEDGLVQIKTQKQFFKLPVNQDVWVLVKGHHPISKEEIEKKEFDTAFYFLSRIFDSDGNILADSCVFLKPNSPNFLYYCLGHN
jgi:hypothetical protein